MLPTCTSWPAELPALRIPHQPGTGHRHRLGNIAEEATFLDVPCITLNTYAEHPETWRIGTNELVGENSFALSASLDKLLHGEWKHTTLPDRWDGRTAERIVQTL